MLYDITEMRVVGDSSEAKEISATETRTPSAEPKVLYEIMSILGSGPQHGIRGAREVEAVKWAGLAAGSAWGAASASANIFPCMA